MLIALTNLSSNKVSQTRPDSVKEFYESKTWKFHHVTNVYERARLRDISEFLSPNSTDIVLDEGCGGGTYTEHLAKFSTAIASDISRNALANAQASLRRLSNRIHFIVCDIEHLPLRNNIVDKIACVDILEHVMNVNRSILEIARVLKTSGRVLIFTACGNNRLTLEYVLRPVLGELLELIRSKFGHIQIFTTQDLLSLLSPQFVIVKTEYMHHWLGWFLKFLSDVAHLGVPQPQLVAQMSNESAYSFLSRLIWLILDAEHRLLKRVSSGTEITISASKR